VELIDSFRIGCPIDEAWNALNDVSLVARCVPGAHLTEVHGDEYRGVVSVRLGVLSARFNGAATFDADVDRRRIMVQASGRGNQGDAEAHITATLEELSEIATQVNVDTDLQIGGRVAQLGRGIIPEVSSTLTAQFAENLGASLQRSASGPDPFGTEGTDHHVVMPEPEALDLLDAARRPIMKRVGPAVMVVGVAAVTRRVRRNGRAKTR